MVSRRAALALLATGTAGVIADRTAVRPDIRLRSGSVHLHPVAKRAVENGIGSEEKMFATVAPPAVTELAGSSPPPTVIDALERAETEHEDRVIVVTQFGSTTDTPQQFLVDSAGWQFPRTLELSGHTDSFDPSFSDLKKEERERFEQADRLISTGVWTLSPRPRWAPSEAVLDLNSRKVQNK